MKSFKQQLILLQKDNKLFALSQIKDITNPNYYLKTKIIYLTNFLSKETKIAERVYYILNNLTEIKKCKCGCGKNVKNYKNDYYSNKCSASFKETRNKYKQTCIEKYGVDNVRKIEKVKEKYKQTCIEKYGVDSTNKLLATKSKIATTKKLKYGDKNYNNIDKYKQTCIEKYGVDSYFKTQKFKEQREETCMEIYGVKHSSSNQEIQDKIRTRHYKVKYDKILTYNSQPLFNLFDYKGNRKYYPFKCKTCDFIFNYNLQSGRIPLCHKCFPLGKGLEIELQEFITSLNIRFKSNDRKVLKGQELDIYIPEKKLAIEFNGLYWHSEGQGKDKNYHLNKTNLCEQQDIQLIHIFEDEWIYKKQIVKARLKHILGLTKYKIYGRKCIIKEIDSKTKNKFLDKYHIQGADKSSIKLGTFYKNRLVAVMTFGKRRICMGKKNSAEGEYELMRFLYCCKF